MKVQAGLNGIQMNNEILLLKIKKLFEMYPQTKTWFAQISMPIISEEMTLQELFKSVSELWLRDSGFTQTEVLSVIENIILETEKVSDDKVEPFCFLSVLGGTDKDGKKEDLSFVLKPGDVYAITGLTGSGKTRLLEDIEYLAEGDSPSGRKILINGNVPTEQERNYYEHKLCASLSQSMNFVMELSCSEFIRLHAECRRGGISEAELEKIKHQVIDCANSLAGEKIDENSIITQLSGGQSRALMIADIAFVSDAPVVLIDEPENAGIDKDEILTILSSKGKIVLVSTHDPVIALSCPKRILIKNGAVDAILTRTTEEMKLLVELKEFDFKLKTIRDCIRKGKNVC